MLLPALAAAVVARMESLPVALGAGIGLGIFEQIARWNTSSPPSFVDAALRRGHRWPRSSCPRAGRSAVRRHDDVVVVRGHHRAAPSRTCSDGYPRCELAIGRWGSRCSPSPRWWSDAHGSASNQLTGSFALVWAMVGVSLVVLTGLGRQHQPRSVRSRRGRGPWSPATSSPTENMDLIFVLLPGRCRRCAPWPS